MGSRLPPLIELNIDDAADALVDRLSRHYDPLSACRVGDKLQIDITGLGSSQQASIRRDIHFYQANTKVPLENVCSTLDNYEPKNDTQREALASARSLVAFQGMSQPAGLWLHGDTGVGKSHVSVGVAKEFMEQGYNPMFYQCGVDFSSPKLKPRQVWVIDDLNSPYGPDRDFFKGVK